MAETNEAETLFTPARVSANFEQKGTGLIQLADYQQKWTSFVIMILQ